MFFLSESQESLEIGQFGHVAVRAVTTSTPWEISADALVVPTGPHIQDLSGGLARALQMVLGPDGWGRLRNRIGASAAVEVEPYAADRPLLVATGDLAVSASLPPVLILATAFQDPSEPTLAHTATLHVLRAFRDEAPPPSLNRVVLPLLGAGDGGANAVKTATAMLRAVWKFACEMPGDPMELVLVSHKPEDWQAVRMAVSEIKRGKQTPSLLATADRQVRRVVTIAERVAARRNGVMEVGWLLHAMSDAAFLVPRRLTQRGAAIVTKEIDVANLVQSIIKHHRGYSTGLFTDLRETVSGDIKFGSIKLSSTYVRLIRDSAAASVKEKKPEFGINHLLSSISKIFPNENFPDINPENFTRAIEKIFPDLGGLAKQFLESISLSESQSSKSPPTRRITRFQADTTTGPDLLGVDRDAKAFAELVTLRATQPPLSIALFGDWGSGKSFFMERMGALAQQVAQAARESGDRQFCHHIVPIRFNAWHYVEQNLWASLVHHIFQELDRWIRDQETDRRPDDLFDQLATARRLRLEALEGLVAAGLATRQAETEVAKARKVYGEAVQKKSLHGTETMLAAVRRAFQPEALAKVKDNPAKAISELANGTGIEGLEQHSQQLLELWQTGGTLSTRAWVLWRGLRQTVPGWEVLVLAVGVIAFPFGLAAMHQWTAHALESTWLQQARLELSSLLVTLTGAAAVVRAWLNRAKPVLDKLEKVRTALDAIATEAVAGEADQIATAEAGAEQARLALQDSERRFHQAQDALSAAERDYVAQGAAGRLTRFIRERAGGGDYSRHLTLVATIRKDFEYLSELMAGMAKGDNRAKQHALAANQRYRQRLGDLLDRHKDSLPKEVEQKIRQAMPDETGNTTDLPSFDRIVLFIDDLDRCPPDKVVEVLQAVHLLLAFPLFVVVVAVDSRWVERSLERHYSGMLRQDKGSAAAAGPRDYLEKIFQIPFWVEPMDGVACGRFLDGVLGLIPDGDSADAPGPVGTGAKAAGAIDATSGGGRDEGPATTLSSTDNENENMYDDGEPDPEANQGPATAPKQPESEVALPPIPILAPLGRRDREAIRLVAPLLSGSPRRAKRFLNIYQIIRTQLASGGADESGAQDLVTPIVLSGVLALNTAYPEQGEKLYASLASNVEDEPYDVVAGKAGNSAVRALGIVRQAASDAGILDEALLRQRMLQVATLVRRFTFDGPGNGDLFPPSPDVPAVAVATPVEPSP